MRILEYNKKKKIMRVIPENIDDLWVLYNVIRQGDQIYTRTSREIKVEEEGSRPTRGKRIAMNLGIRVEKLSFQNYNDRLRTHGIIIEAPEKYGLLSNHHTINIHLGKPVNIFKEEWLNYDLNRIKRSSQQVSAPIIVVALDDEKGCVALLRQYGIDVKVEIDVRLPGKNEMERRDSALTNYFNSILKELVLASNESHSLIAVIGPGFWKEIFVKYVKERQPALFKNISAVRSVANGGVAGVEEAVRSGVLDVIARKLRVIEETRAVESFLSRLGLQRKDVSYGIDDVKKAIDYGSVDLLLIADVLLREADEEVRRNMENYMRDVEKMRGRTMIVSTKHEAGKNLLGLGGVAALLRFSVG